MKKKTKSFRANSIHELEEDIQDFLQITNTHVIINIAISCVYIPGYEGGVIHYAILIYQ